MTTVRVATAVARAPPPVVVAVRYTIMGKALRKFMRQFHGSALRGCESFANGFDVRFVDGALLTLLDKVDTIQWFLSRGTGTWSGFGEGWRPLLPHHFFNTSA